jgi:hypothetical protein
MQFQERPQLPLRLVQLGRERPAPRQFDAQPLRGRAQRIAIRLTCSATMNPLRSSERIALSASGSALAR